MLKLRPLLIEVLKEDDPILGKTGVVGLSKIDKDTADAAIGSGFRDGDSGDDKIKGGKKKIPVGALKPAQSELIKEKAFGMLIDFVTKNKYENADLGNIVSNDNYIMDGHHRWAAIYLIDPKASVNVTEIDLPGQALVTVLNTVTVGKLGITAGNKGKGNLASFTGANFEAIIDDALANGIPGDFPKSTQEVNEALGMIPGANGDAQAGKAIVMKNADKMPDTKMPGAPARVEMPVIDAKKVAIVQKMLAKGAIDIKAPHSPETAKAMDTGMYMKDESIKLKDLVTTEDKSSKKQMDKISGDLASIFRGGHEMGDEWKKVKGDTGQS
jgi:hypothetical protein